MRRLLAWPGVASVACAALAAPGCERAATPPAAAESEVVVRVDGEPILRSEIDLLAAYLAPVYPNATTDRLRSFALSRSLVPRAIALARGRDAVTSIRARIEAAKARLDAGEPFDAVAAEVSDEGRDQRGDAGIVLRADLDPILGLEAFTAPVGEVRGPLATSDGFHLIRVTERSESGRALESTVHLHRIVALLEVPPPTREVLRERLEHASIEVVDGDLYDRIRPVGLGVRYGPSPSPSQGVSKP